MEPAGAAVAKQPFELTFLKHAEAAGKVARQKEVNNPRRLWIARVHGVPAEPRPHWRKAAKRLPAGQLVAAVDALCFRRGKQSGDVVAVFSVARREHFARRGIFEDPLAGLVAPAPEVRRGA